MPQETDYIEYLSMTSWSWMAFAFASSASVRLALLYLSSSEHTASNSSSFPFNLSTSTCILKDIVWGNYLQVGWTCSSKKLPPAHCFDWSVIPVECCLQLEPLWWLVELVQWLVLLLLSLVWLQHGLHLASLANQWKHFVGLQSLVL